MFSSGAKRPNPGSRRDRNLGQAVTDSPVTPLPGKRKPVIDNSIPDRPSTGTPAPWATRLSVIARVSPSKSGDKGNDVDPIRPVYVGEFPQVVRDEQAIFLQKFLMGGACIAGGMDKETSLAWIICGNKLFIWSYWLPVTSVKCVVLELPTNVLDNVGSDRDNGNRWLLSAISWNSKYQKTKRVMKNQNSAGIILCDRKTQFVMYWPDIYSEERTPVTYVPEVTSSSVDGKNTPPRQRMSNGSRKLNSLIASAVPGSKHVCVAFACCSNDELWQFFCSPNGIHMQKVCQSIASASGMGCDGGQNSGTRGYPRSLIWHFPRSGIEEPEREFLLLTDHEIQCFTVKFLSEPVVSKLWSYEIIGTDNDLGIKKDLAGQKRILPLDMMVDEHGKVITILVATFCKDRASSSNYTKYSLLTLQYKSGISKEPTHGRVLEKRAPIQEIIPKARVEDEDYLFSMRLRIGGKPSGSSIILSNDGTATVSHYNGNSPRLYQFELPYDAGKVLDASVLPSTEDSEEGAWVILTEKAGVWAIPEKAIILGGVEPPERSLSRKGSANERSAEEERRNPALTSNAAFRRTNAEAWDAGGRRRAAMAGAVHRSARDEESEALLGQLFHDFLMSGQVDAALEKLQNSGAFERDGETNIFSRMSKSIVDTLSKHWTTTRGAEIVAMTIISSQLMDKQQKHEKFLQFLALSKCHEELCTRQRYSLQIILEHGEKLAAMIQLRELQNVISHRRSTGGGSSLLNSEGQMVGAFWDLIQLVGESARRNTVLLMDRDNAEVFYSRVSDLEEVFYCLDRKLEDLLSVEQLSGVQNQRACELSNACVSILHTAMHYKNEHQLWYPPSEGLTPWYAKSVVRNGLWSIAAFMLQLLNNAYELDVSARSDLYSQMELLAEVLLEAYSSALKARAEQGEEPEGLLDEFSTRRDTILNSLYQKVKKGFSGGAPDQVEEILAQHSSRLLSIAKQHECYSVLWNICGDLDDSELLRSLMHGSMGPKGGFCYFVFQQLYEKKQFSKLLRLGEEFHQQLLIFLKQRRELQWLHDFYLHNFLSASETLHELALSPAEKTSDLVSEEQTETGYTHVELRLADRKRLLNLAKIAAMAGNHVDSDLKLMRIEADLKILKLQEEIAILCPNIEAKQYIDKDLLHPEEFVGSFLEKGNPVKALEVFAWTSSSFRRTHKKLLEECRQNAADQDDWSKLYQESVDEGWGDEDTLLKLRATVLFQASSRC